MKRTIFGIKKSGRPCLTAHLKRAYRLIGSATPISASHAQPGMQMNSRMIPAASSA